jgi:hypothetical protein
MNRAIKIVLAAVLALIAGSLALASPAAAATPNSHVGYATATMTNVMRPATAASPAVYGKAWSWPDLHSGDCTMFSGAKWSLYSDGTATFDGIVTSSDSGDAWLQWVHLKDANNAEFGKLVNSYPQTSDTTEFIQGLPDDRIQYHWTAYGHFDPNWYSRIQHVSMEYRC